MAERVLIIDDSKDIREFLIHYILKPKGFQISVAVSGREGLDQVIATRPDLVITDDQMPEMSGLEMLAEIKKRGLNIPTILMTAYGSEETAVEAFRLGVRDYIIKPIDVEELSAAIERALRETRLQKERDELVERLMRSNNQLERRVQELNTLYSIGKSVSSSLNIETVLHRVVEAATYFTGAEEGSLMLLDETQDDLFVRASKNLDQTTQSIRLRVKDSLAGQVMRTGRPLIIGDDDRWQKIKTAYLVKSLIYVPLISQDKAIGVLSVANRSKSEPFENHETRILSALADYAAVAIHNANLYSQSENERNKLLTILGQTDDPVLIVNEKNQLELANKAARTALELPAGDLRQYPIHEIIDNEDILALLDQQPGLRLGRSAEVTAADGRVFSANMTVIDGVGRSIVLRDISQLKELDRLKSEFVAVVSHDLRSPLTSILGYVQLMERVGPLNESQKEFAQRVQASVTNITSLINDLLDLGRLEAGLDLTLTECDLAAIIGEALAEFQLTIQEKELDLNQEIADDVPLVLGDHNRLQQAIGNLVNNAVKYTPEKGKVRLCLEEQEEQIILKIADTGLGIAPADQPYIFDKFYRADDIAARFEGTGLGLSIVKSVVERHHGRIWVDSEVGKGTTFTIVLPTVHHAKAIADAPAKVSNGAPTHQP